MKTNPRASVTSFVIPALLREWQRSGVPIVLFAGLFGVPLLLHALARHLA
jgi:hypothetical protein